MIAEIFFGEIQLLFHGLFTSVINIYNVLFSINKNYKTLKKAKVFIKKVIIKIL